MKIIALSVIGKEFLYNPKTAHKVNAARAKDICDIVNNCKFQLKDGYSWFIHDIDEYDAAYIYATMQRFVINKAGAVKQKTIYYN